MDITFTIKGQEVHCECGNFSWNIFNAPPNAVVHGHIKADHGYDGSEELSIHTVREERL